MQCQAFCRLSSPAYFSFGWSKGSVKTSNTWGIQGKGHQDGKDGGKPNHFSVFSMVMVVVATQVKVCMTWAVRIKKFSVIKGVSEFEFDYQNASSSLQTTKSLHT